MPKRDNCNKLYCVYHALARFLITHHKDFWRSEDAGISFLDAFYTKPRYYGETAAHICAAKGEAGLLRLLIDCGADVVSPRCCGTFFLNWRCASASTLIELMHKEYAVSEAMLNNIPLLKKKLSKEQRSELACSMWTLNFTQGDPIILPGVEADCVYFVVKGKVTEFEANEAGHIVEYGEKLATYEPNDFFGLDQLLPGFTTRRRTYARAGAGKTTLLRISTASLENMLFLQGELEEQIRRKNQERGTRTRPRMPCCSFLMPN